MTFLANLIWYLSSLPQYRLFCKNLKTPEIVQNAKLEKIILHNLTTQYLSQYNLKNHSIREFQQKIPVTEYSDYIPWINKISRGEQNILSHDTFFLFEPTSGSGSRKKLIPYNKSLKNEFNRGILPWVASLFKSSPEILKGSSYWSISPAFQKQDYFGILPIGFESDADYIGFTGKLLQKFAFAVPAKVSNLMEKNMFFLETWRYLLANEKLSFISIWSPTFLLTLIEFLKNNREEIFCRIYKDVNKTRRCSLEKNLAGEKINFNLVWPKLKIISSWTHGNSAYFVDDLKLFFPQTRILAKGLIATEAFVSLPFTEDADPILSIHSHFFEFESMNNGEIYLINDLEKGEIYNIIVTTGGGFYRYRLNDLVEVTGFIGKTPALRFVGNCRVSDLVGEKLNSSSIDLALKELYKELNIRPIFHLVAPALSGKPGYILFLDAPISRDQAQCFSNLWEKKLCKFYHYQYARQLGQLQVSRLFLINHKNGSSLEKYKQCMINQGMKPGDIKTNILDTNRDNHVEWNNIFSGEIYVAQ